MDPSSSWFSPKLPSSQLAVSLQNISLPGSGDRKRHGWFEEFRRGTKEHAHNQRNRRWWGVAIEGGKNEDHKEAEGMTWRERDQGRRNDVWLQLERA